MIFSLPIFTPYYYQNVPDFNDVIRTNDATIQGILLGVIIALCTALIYIYKEKSSERERLLSENNKLRTEYISALKDFNAQLIVVNKSYSEAINFLKTGR